MSMGKQRCCSHHDAGLTIIFAWWSLDNDASFRSLLVADLANESSDALVAGGELIGVDKILPDGFGVASSGQAEFDGIAERFAGAGRWTAGWLRCCAAFQDVGRVGDHRLAWTGRFWRIRDRVASIEVIVLAI